MKIAAFMSLAALCTASAAYASDDNAVTSPAARPAIESNRWEEDWSVLADPALRTEPFDSLKYIPLSVDDPHSYLSLGLNLRERFESNDAANFGVGNTAADAYLLQRLQVHADLHLNANWELFTQLEDARAFDKQNVTPVDKNPLDLRLAFLAYSNAFADGTFKARVGRQDFLFDLQRFVSSRDGPNVRQSFDAIWAGWEAQTWRIIGFVSQPVQYTDEQPFDDMSNRHFRFNTVRVERYVFGHDELSAYYAVYKRDDAKYLFASGDERRNVFDARFAGTTDGFDWDVEGMQQSGAIGAKRIDAWAIGARAGYTYSPVPWQPRLGIQLDAASGNRHPQGDELGTFNPLFPNGYYFSLAGYTGYANLIQLKPSLTVKPVIKFTLMAALGCLWRETTADAIYVQPNVPVAGTAGRAGSWTGDYAQLRGDYAFNRNTSGAIEAVRYHVGDVIRQVGGHDSDYLGIELKYGW